jgi:hypothetical protein
MTRSVVFLGPTLDVASARHVLDADYRSPVQRGDVLRVLYRDPDTIGIIDGYFHTVRSVWHKEILLALERGVRVYGAASMGALRAAELHRFGMIGVGEVFTAYHDGQLDDDDEVAVLHATAEQGYRPLSVAMVDIRDAYAAAAAADVVSACVVDQLIAIAKALHYAERSHRRVLTAARRSGVLARDVNSLIRFLRGYGPAVKHRDALAMLYAIASAHTGDAPQPPRACPRVERTSHLRALEAEVFAQEFPWGRVTGFRRVGAGGRTA